MTDTKCKLALCLALAVHAPSACRAAERYVFDVFDQDRGLGNPNITRLMLDRHGALWIGTEGGLYRYDGHRFVAFTVNEGLPSNKITAIHESPDGTLWVGTLEGLAWRDGAGFRKSANEPLRGYVNLQGIASDRTGRVFIATRKGVAVTSTPRRGQDAQVNYLQWPISIPEHRSSNVYSAGPDELWFDCGTSICRWNGTEVRVWGQDAGVPDRRWDFFLKDKSGNLWARNRDYLIELASGGDRFKVIGPDVPGGISINDELTIDNKGKILVTTSRGLAIGGPDGWRYITERHGLPTNLVTAAVQDSEGSMWLGTYGAGLIRWAGYDAWRSFTQMEGLPSSYIDDVLDDPPSGIWVGTTGGLSHGKFSNGTWNWSDVSIPGAAWVSELVRAKDGAVWMITDRHYLVRYDPAARTVRRLGPLGEGPYHIRIDSNGRLWIADHGGILVGPAETRLEAFESILPSNASPSTTFTRTLEDASGNLWLGSMSGLFRKSGGKWFHYDKSNGLSALRIWGLALSPQGELWVAYSDLKGMDRVRVSGEAVKVENFDHSNGLPDDHVNSIEFDRKGQMWVLNDRGMALRRGDSWLQFGRPDGLIASDTAAGAFADAHDGAIWVGTSRGLSRYQPPETGEKHAEPLRVTFSEIRVGDQAVDPVLERVVGIRPQTFEFKFSALLLAHVADLRYRYRFVGLDDRWRETVRPEVRLDYPPAGRYSLEVQARRQMDAWNGPAARLAIEVRPRWYETWVFRGVLLALLGAAVWLGENIRKRKAEVARLALERVVDQRTAELRESEKRLKNAERLAHVGHWSLDIERNHADWSDELCRILGKPQGYAPVPEEFWQIFVSEDREKFKRWIRDCIAKRRGSSAEFRMARTDGEERTIICASDVLLDEKGSPVRVFGACQDITESKRAQEDALARQKLETLGTVAGGIAHDFNNLLGAVAAQAELAVTELAAGESPFESIQRITNATNRGAEIVRELMIYAGQDKPGPVEPIDLSRLVDEMEELFKSSIPKHVVLKTDLSDDLPAVLGRASQLRQIMMNLIINGSEAIGEKGGIVVIAASGTRLLPRETLVGAANLPPGEYLKLEVSDTGVGMTEELQAKIFDPFFTTKFAGRGLGLAVVHGLVRDLGGSIYVMSDPGKGSTFQILLPSAATTAGGTRSSISQTRDPASPSLQPFSVLVAEDEAALRDAVAKMLRHEGFTVLDVGDGSAALGVIRADVCRLDVLLLDLNLPGASSQQIFQEARRLRPEMKVIVTSAYTEDVAKAALQGDVEHFLRKPYKFRDLVDSVRNL